MEMIVRHGDDAIAPLGRGMMDEGIEAGGLLAEEPAARPAADRWAPAAPGGTNG